MCDICEHWGDGGKWYLNRKNHGWKYKYGDDPDLEEFFKQWLGDWGNWQMAYEKIRKLEGMKDHQVVPLEDAQQMLDIAAEFAQGDSKAFGISDCPCTMTYAGEKVKKCMSFGTLVELSPHWQRQMDYIPLEEAKAKLVEFDRKGYVHTTNSMGTVLGGCYVVQLCNCAASTCSRMRMRDFGHPYTSKGEYIADIDPTQCTGCRRCLSYCQYGAMRFDPVTRRTWVDVRVCQGCGVCRAQCEAEAIHLLDRAKVPAAANLW